jgi:hypothetical protein
MRYAIPTINASCKSTLLVKNSNPSSKNSTTCQDNVALYNNSSSGAYEIDE